MSRRKRIRRPLRWTVATLVMVSILLWLLPERWSRWMVHGVQFLIPFQHASSRTLDAVTLGVDSWQSLEDGSDEALRIRQRAAQEHQVAALAVRIEQLEQEVGHLSASRSWQAEGRALGLRGRLIPAQALTEDILPWRDSRWVLAGSAHGVQRKDAVVSAWFSLDLQEGGEVQSGWAVLLSEVLVGWIDQVATHSARVKLVSDVGVQLKVRVGRFEPEGYRGVDRYFWLVGRGRGVMELHDLERREVEAGQIQLGDLVLSDPSSEVLPAALRIGSIFQIDPDRDNPLLATAQVRCDLDPRDLRKVYIYDPGG